jgi:hypothetical protein
MKKTIKILSFLILVLIAIFLSYVFLDPTQEKISITSTRMCPYFEKYIKTAAEYTYINSVLGFSLKIPQGWYVTPTDDLDPRFYNCDNVAGGPSFGIYPTYEGAYNNYKKELAASQDEVYTNLIPGVLFIKNNMKDLDHAPWGYLFDIVFEKEKKMFNLIVDGNIEESTVLRSLKLNN